MYNLQFQYINLHKEYIQTQQSILTIIDIIIWMLNWRFYFYLQVKVNNSHEQRRISLRNENL